MIAELADGLWRWTARHPEWHPGAFGAEVACFALRDDDGLVLVDPLLPQDGADDVLAVLDDAPGAVTIVITIPYHVRSAAELAQRYDGEVLGHRAVQRRLPAAVRFTAVQPGDPLRGGMTVHAIGRPRRYEQPLHVPAHRALCFGDAIVESGGALRVWAQKPIDAAVTRFYRERFAPSAEPLLELDADRVLPTHGAPVLTGGRAALAAALRARPWNPSRR
jgi:glyoxylase-like metal-dependent hydrolase (beta-lactamase superfamily II)